MKRILSAILISALIFGLTPTYAKASLGDQPYGRCHSDDRGRKVPVPIHEAVVIPLDGGGSGGVMNVSLTFDAGSIGTMNQIIKAKYGSGMFAFLDPKNCANLYVIEGVRRGRDGSCGGCGTHFIVRTFTYYNTARPHPIYEYGELPMNNLDHFVGVYPKMKHETPDQELLFRRAIYNSIEGILIKAVRAGGEGE